MPTTRKAITFSMPPEMAEQVQQVLKEEGRNMSEFLREAIRLYMQERAWLRQERRPTGRGPPERSGVSKEDTPMDQLTLHARGPLCQSIQRQAGRGPLRCRTAAGAQGLCTQERVPRRPRVRGRGRKRAHRRQAGVPQDDRRGQQDQRPVQGDSGLEVLPLHTQARARSRLQILAPAQGRPSRLHHRAGRRHSHRQAA